MEILNELYLGRKPVEPLRTQLSIIRNKYKNKKITPSTNLDPEILKFNKIAQSIFGFHNFSLNINPDNYPNAFCFPVDTYYSEEDKVKIYKSLIASPTGFKYNEAMHGVSLLVSLNIGNFNLDNLTDDEIMATILHEIGHGFFEAVVTPDNAYTSSRKLSSIILSVSKFASDKIKKGKSVTMDVVNREVDTFSKTIKGIKKSFMHLTKKIFKESMEDNLKGNRIDYTNEKFADTFAAMYGYGEECSSGDIKIAQYIYKNYTKQKKYPKIIELIKMYKMYFGDMLEFVLDIQDPHPAQLARVKTTADYLRREISKEGIDPSMKRELIEELNKVNTLIDQYRNFPKDQDSMRIVRLYNNKLYEKFGGDRRENDTDNNALFDLIDSKYNALDNKGIEECGMEFTDNYIIEADNYSDMDIFLDVICASADCYNESMIDDIKQKVIDVKDLWKQWEKSTKGFIKHKWIYRYVNEKQKMQIQNHYEKLKDPNIYYSTYKRSFNAICKFFGLPNDSVIIENIVFNKDKDDKNLEVVAIRFSKGKVKVTIPEGINLIHAHVANDGVTIDNLIPTFRSKTVGKYMYPTKRCFFTCIKPITNFKSGTTGAMNKYTPKQHITTAYIDPTYSDFSVNSVYVETETPIPVQNYYTMIDKIKNKFKKEG